MRIRAIKILKSINEREKILDALRKIVNMLNENDD